MGRSGGCQKHKAPQNIRRSKRNTGGKLHPVPRIPFIPVHSAAGFCALWFLMVMFSTLLAGLPLGCWTATPTCIPPTTPAQRRLDALGAYVPPEWPFTNNWLVQQNESPVPLPGIGTKFKQIHSPEFPLEQGYATVVGLCLVALLGFVPVLSCSPYAFPISPWSTYLISYIAHKSSTQGLLLGNLT